MPFCPLIKSECRTDCVFNTPSGCQIYLALSALGTDATALIKTTVCAITADHENRKSK